jgi:cytochrome c oxidase assembly protein subunit 15
MASAPVNPIEIPGASTGSRGLHRLAVAVAGSTLFLIFAGGLVTSTGSGLAVPDWPLSFGRFFPPMRGGVFYEHGHRMVAGVVGLLTLAMAVWAWVGEPRRGMRRLAGIAVIAVVAQALLGGLTVLLRLPTWVSVSHACLAQAFLCLVVALAVLSGRARPRRLQGPEELRRGRRLAAIAVTLTGLAFGQLLLGALVRHLGAGLAFRDFPLANGQLFPPLTTAGVAVHYFHRLGAVAVVAAMVILMARVFRLHGDEPLLVRPAVAGLGLVAVQILLGGAIIWTGKAVLPTTAHVVTGAGVLAASLILTIRSFQAVAPPTPAAARQRVEHRQGATR